MTNTLLIKRSATNSAPSSLNFGELAWSDNLSTLFIGKSGGLVEPVGGIGYFQSISENLTDLSLIPTTPSDEGTVPIVNSLGTLIGRKGNDLLSAIGVLGNYLPITGGTLTGPLSINHLAGVSLVTTKDVSIGIADPTLGMSFNPNDRLLTISGEIDRPGIAILNNPKTGTSLVNGDIAGRLSFTLSSLNYPLKTLGYLEAYAEGQDSNIGGALRVKIKTDGSSQLIEPLTINSKGDVLIGYGGHDITLPSPLSLATGDRLLSILSMDGAHGYLVMGQGLDKGVMRWDSGEFQYLSGSSWMPIGGSTSSYSETIGDGTSTSITVVHNLGTRDIIWQLYQTSGSYEDGIPRVRRLTTNSIQMVFNQAPALNSYRVVIHK
jgi:hypothetical protein